MRYPHLPSMRDGAYGIVKISRKGLSSSSPYLPAYILMSVCAGIGKNQNMNNAKSENTVALVKQEINRQLADKETMESLLATTFKGLEAPTMKRALLEGMLRGFSFTEFLNGDVYAVPFANGYSLVTSIDRSRKIGARNGVVGVKAPVYKMDGDRIVSCLVTVLKRFPDGYVGEFEAEPDFKEYSTGKNLWASKPKTMIAKVAEMHALRKACPEELAQAYVEEEFQKGETPVHTPSLNLDALRKMLDGCKTTEDLERAWADIPGDAKPALKEDMERVKAMIISEATID